MKITFRKTCMGAKPFKVHKLYRKILMVQFLE